MYLGLCYCNSGYQGNVAYEQAPLCARTYTTNSNMPSMILPLVYVLDMNQFRASPLRHSHKPTRSHGQRSHQPSHSIPQLPAIPHHQQISHAQI